MNSLRSIIINSESDIPRQWKSRDEAVPTRHLTALPGRRASPGTLNFIAAEFDVCIRIRDKDCALEENRDIEIPESEGEGEKLRLPVNREVKGEMKNSQREG
jgi:hypothetical protein